MIAANPDIANLFLYSTTAENRERLTTSNLYEMRRCYRGTGERRIQDFLTNSGKFDATDPRDKVFALVGLSDNIDNHFIDYELDSRKVFQLIQILLLRTPGASTQMLGFGYLGKYFEDLPSWTCQWRSHGETDRLPLYIFYPTVSAPANSGHILQHVDGVCHLRMSAVIFDCIEEYVPFADLSLINEGSLRRLEEVSCMSNLDQGDLENFKSYLSGYVKFLHQCVQLVQKLKAYPTGQSLDEVLWRAYLFNTTIRGEVPAPEQYGDLFKKLVKSFDLLTRLDLFDPTATKLPVRSPITVIQVEILVLSMVLIFCWNKEIWPRTIWQWITLTL